jgi:hypothetical protein
VPSRLGYEAVFAAPSVEFFVNLSRRQQRRMLDRAHELAADPFLVPDFQTEDAAGRKISHLMADGFIFDFWVDHSARQIVIIEIASID